MTGANEVQIYTVSKDGALFRWAYMQRPSAEQLNGDVDGEDNMRWRIADRHYFMQNNAYVTCAAYHAASDILVVGFSNGIFGLYELPDFNQIHNLRSVSLASIYSGR